jgi:small subunit ribosomal protein S21
LEFAKCNRNKKKIVRLSIKYFYRKNEKKFDVKEKSYIFATQLKLLFNMIIVPVKEGESVDKALKKYKRKFEKTGVMKELRERKAFKKPSIRRREQIIKAIYIQKLQQGLITR